MATKPRDLNGKFITNGAKPPSEGCADRNGIEQSEPNEKPPDWRDDMRLCFKILLIVIGLLFVIGFLKRPGFYAAMSLDNIKSSISSVDEWVCPTLRGRACELLNSYKDAIIGLAKDRLICKASTKQEELFALLQKTIKEFHKTQFGSCNDVIKEEDANDSNNAADNSCPKDKDEDTKQSSIFSGLPLFNFNTFK